VRIGERSIPKSPVTEFRAPKEPVTVKGRPLLNAPVPEMRKPMEPVNQSTDPGPSNSATAAGTGKVTAAVKRTNHPTMTVPLTVTMEDDKVTVISSQGPSAGGGYRMPMRANSVPTVRDRLDRVNVPILGEEAYRVVQLMNQGVQVVKKVTVFSVEEGSEVLQVHSFLEEGSIPMEEDASQVALRKLQRIPMNISYKVKVIEMRTDLRELSCENEDPDLHMVSEVLSELWGWESPRLAATQIVRLRTDNDKVIQEVTPLTDKLENSRKQGEELQSQLVHTHSDAEEKYRDANAAKRISDELLHKNMGYQEEIQRLKRRKVKDRSSKIVSTQAPTISKVSCGSQMGSLVTTATTEA